MSTAAGRGGHATPGPDGAAETGQGGTARPDPALAAARRLVGFTDVRELRGPLLVMGGVEGVGWDEFAVVEVEGGEERHALVLEVDGTDAVLQVLEGTGGLAPGGLQVRFEGRPLHVAVGAQWLGRVCNGRGVPLDGGPPVASDQAAPVSGWPLNPVYREPPQDPVVTGVSVIDALTTLVRGQKLPIFSVAGLPHLTLATQLAAQATTSGRPFRVVFAAMGMTHSDIAYIRDRLEERSAAGELVLLLNSADDPVIERILTPRIALTIAEYLAYENGDDVLVVMSDMTSYAEAVREVSAARREIPARRGYPGNLYSDLATLYERCGRVRGREGSVTIVPVLTMPAGDMTHPVPDLTGYITEGQVVLSPELDSQGIYPPVDVLASLSRLMRSGAGPGRTRPEHLDVAAQILSAMARARQAAELAELVGEAALSATDRSYLAFRAAVEQQLFNQGRSEVRSLDDTFELAWRALSLLPARELIMIDPQMLREHLPPADGEPGP